MGPSGTLSQGLQTVRSRALPWCGLHRSHTMAPSHEVTPVAQLATKATSRIGPASPIPQAIWPVSIRRTPCSTKQSSGRCIACKGQTYPFPAADPGSIVFKHGRPPQQLNTQMTNRNSTPCTIKQMLHEDVQRALFRALMRPWLTSRRSPASKSIKSSPGRRRCAHRKHMANFFTACRSTMYAGASLTSSVMTIDHTL